ncbi:MAG: ATP-binding protein [Proteobacteria bacterium]|nr:ATP-binding protein [Pseudomonadota bacterium]
MSEQHQIQINLPGLLRMLGENIYAEPDVAIREMIQNAHDSCIIRGTEDRSYQNPQIHVSFDKKTQTIVIADNGTGMTEAGLHKNLSTIGESFTRIQRDQLREKDAHEAALLIGQFGIGLLSAFSISRQVEIITRSSHAEGGLRWICAGDIHYSVEANAKPEPGTRVILHLLASKIALLDEERLRQAIKKYADFLSIPIYLNGNQANACTPPWESKNTDLSEYIQARWSLFPLGIIPFNAEEMTSDGTLPNVSGLLFIPMIPFELTRQFGEVDIYISRMFIKSNDKELLPRWASFVKGVINTPELTPTLSRGEIIVDAAYQQIRAMLGQIIIDYLDWLQTQDPDRLTMLVGAYNNTIKAHALEDDEFFDRIADLVRVNTDTGLIPMRDYLAKSKGILYYFAERGSGTQHKVLFAHKGLPVIDASWGVEEEFLERYAQRRNVPLERLAADSGLIFKILETVDEKWQDLERAFHRQVHKEAKAVEFDPDTVPAVLVARPLSQDDKRGAELDAMGAQVGLGSSAIKQMFNQMAKQKSQRSAGEDTLLHLNARNPLIRQLRDMPRNETFYLALTCIYNNAVMFSQHYVSPENAETIFNSNNNAFSAMIATAQALALEQQERAKVEMERDKLKRQLPEIQLTEYRSCFFAFDYKIEDNYRLLEYIQEYFMRKELGIKVMAPAKAMDDLNTHRNMHQQLKQAHFGIADISNNNLNVLYESGLLHGMGKPLILLQRTDSKDTVPFDIFSDYRCKYDVTRREGEVCFVWLDKELDKTMNTIKRMLPEFDTLPHWDGKQ